MHSKNALKPSSTNSNVSLERPNMTYLDLAITVLQTSKEARSLLSAGTENSMDHDLAC